MTPVQITEDSRLSDERLRAILNHANISFDDNGYDPDPREIAALVTEVLAAREADAWQPIETAPRDGTDILLLISGKARVARWHPSTSSGPYPSFPWVCQSNENAWRDNAPTHWHPLPTPPALKETTNAA